jgi:hypothetical protein
MFRRHAVLLALTIGAGLLNIANAVAQDAIKLGAVISLSGRFSESAVFMREAYDLWV